MRAPEKSFSPGRRRGEMRIEKTKTAEGHEREQRVKVPPKSEGAEMKMQAL